MPMNKPLILICGKSAVGKSSLVERACDVLNIKAIPSYTTRKPRYKDEQGHTFITNEDYVQLKDIIAENTFCGNKYCVTLDQIENPEYSLYVVDCHGIECMKKKYDGNRQIYIVQIECDEKIRVERLKCRYSKICKNEVETLNKVIERLIADTEEFENIGTLATYCIKNTFDFDESFEQFKELLVMLLNKGA